MKNTIRLTGVIAKRTNRTRKKENRKDHFPEVKARGRAHIHVEIGVMDIMESARGMAPCD
jgi:hypothetical protein